MASKKQSLIPAEKLSLFQKLTSTLPGVEIKGAAMPYTSVNGHMYAFLDPDGNLGLRLPEAARNEFINKFKTQLCEAHGRILKEYVLVPETVFKKTDKLKPWLEISFNYVCGLKPKPGKK